MNDGDEASSNKPRASIDEGARHWSLMTKTRKGVVSILRELTLAECRGAYERLDPEYGRVHFLYAAGPDGGGSGGGGWGRIVSGDEIDIREVFGPAEWDRAAEMEKWNHWPKLETIEWDDPRHTRHWRERANDSGAASIQSLPPPPKRAGSLFGRVFGD